MADTEIPDLKSRDEGQLVYIPEEGTNGHVYVSSRAFTLNDGSKNERYKCIICKAEQAFVCLTCVLTDPMKKYHCHPPGKTHCSTRHEENES